MKLLKAAIIVLALVFQLLPCAAGLLHRSAPGVPSNGGDMLVGLGPVAYGYNGSPFLNWAQAGGSGNNYQINLSPSGTLPIQTAFTNGVIDSNGELVSGSGLSSVASIQKAVFTPTILINRVPVLAGSTPWWNGLQMKITWTGTSTPALAGFSSLGSGSTALSCAGNACTFTFGLNPSNVAFTFSISNVNDPPKNIFIYEVQYQAQVTALATCVQFVNCNHFRPIYLSTINSFGRLRSMDWMSVNDSGEFDLSVMADFNYQLAISSSYGGIGRAFTASISGTVLTVSSVSAGSMIGVGEIVNGIGVTANTQIVSGNCGSSCTGTGGAGTYQVNNSQTVAGESMIFSATTGYAGLGPKGGVHPSVMIELSLLTGADIYFNLPVNITNSGFQALDQYFASHLPSNRKIFYELGNENWNGALGVTAYYLAGAQLVNQPTLSGAVQYSGYRMSELMTIAQSDWGTNSYNKLNNPTGRWGGIIGGQMVNNSAVPAAFITGFSLWQSNVSPATLPANLYSEVVVAPYFSDFPSSIQITGVTPGATTTITCSGCGSYSSGQTVKLFFGNTGGGTVGSVLNGQYVSVGSPSGNTFTFSSISTVGLTYSSAGANDFVAANSNGASGGSQTVKPLYDTAEASVACAGSSIAAIGSGSITGSTLTSSSVTGGPIAIGQQLTGPAGIPANTYIVSGSGSTWTLNNSVVGTVTGAMATVPCPNKYQYFSQETSKALITGAAGDLGYLPAISQPQFQSMLNTNYLFGASYGLSLSQYEGGSQFICNGQMCAIGGDGDLGNLFLNWQWDAAGSDPLYTPAKVYQNQFTMMRNIYLPYSAKYVEQFQAGNFSGIRFYGDTNPSWSAILAESQLGIPVDPTPAAGWSASYAGNATNRFFSNSSCSTPCTDTLSGVITGTAATRAIVMVVLTGGTITSATCDGVTSSTPDAINLSGRPAAIFSLSLSPGSNTRTCSITNSGVSFQNREFYVLTASNLANAGAIANASAAANFPINYTKGGLLVTTVACSTGNYSGTSGVSTPSVSFPTTTALFSDFDTTSGRTAAMAAFNAPFSSPIFSIQQACNQGAAAAVYR